MDLLKENDMYKNHWIIWITFNGVFLLYILGMCIYVCRFKSKQKEITLKNNSSTEETNSKNDALLRFNN